MAKPRFHAEQYRSEIGGPFKGLLVWTVYDRGDFRAIGQRLGLWRRKKDAVAYARKLGAENRR